LALVELSVVEQSYRAVLAAAARVPVTEVAERFGVPRQSVHAWIRGQRSCEARQAQRHGDYSVRAPDSDSTRAPTETAA
jgi:hypothetical protein